MPTFALCRRATAVATLCLAGLVGAAATPSSASAPSDAPLVVTTTALPAAEIGEPLAIQLGAAGGTAPYQWAPEALPPGVTLTSTGLLGGAPTQLGSELLSVTVTGADDEQASSTLVLQVGSGPSIATTSLPAGEVDQSYSAQLEGAGGTAPYAWSVQKGSLPGGLVLSSSGLLSGRPGTAGSSAIFLEVTDSVGAKSDASLRVDILAPPPPPPPPPPPAGYVVVDAAGRATTVGLVAPISRARLGGRSAAVAVEPSGAGYWVTSTTGRVHAFGQARGFGSVARKDLEGRIVGIAAPRGATGYWLVSSTGHVYGFGADRSLGSPPAASLRGQVVGIAAAATGRGYWLATSSGQVFAFGSAEHLAPRRVPATRSPVVAIASSTIGSGYWLATSTGQVEGFGAAKVLSPEAGEPAGTIVSMSAAPPDAGAGYWLLSRSGVVYPFGAARSLVPSSGSAGTGGSAVPFVGIAGAR